MKATKITIFAGFVLLGSLVFVHAQDQDDKLIREMTLEREYDPTIQDANKINRLPDVREPEITGRSIEYSPFTIPANPDREINVLPSGDIMTAIPFNKRRGYFHFGGGMFTNLSGDFGYHLLNDEKDKLNIYLSHRSTNGNVEYLQDDTKQKAVLNDNLAGLDFKHYFSPSILRLGANYDYTMFNYYGWPVYIGDPVISIPSELPYEQPLIDRKTNQVNQTINVYAGLQAKEEMRVGYLLDFEFLRFAQKYGMAKEFEGIQENKYTLRLGLNSAFGDENRRAGFAGKVDIFKYSTYPSDNQISSYYYDPDDPRYKNYIEATITPYYQIKGDNWKAQLGVNLMLITGDSTLSKFFLSPNISADVEIADKTVFYAHAGGEIQSNDAYGLSKLNRYMDYSVMSIPSRTWLDATLGIRSGVVPGLWFDLFAGYKITENELFYIPLTSSYIKSDFAGYYTAYQPDASLFRVGASFKYMYRKWVDFSVRGVYNHWDLKAGDGMSGYLHMDDRHAYGRPAIEVNADLTVKPLNPLALTLGYYLGANRYAMEIMNNEISMKNLSDLNFKASWNFNETFGAYLKLNNLLFQKQELYYGYPLQGFNAMVGINLNF